MIILFLLFHHICQTLIAQCKSQKYNYWVGKVLFTCTFPRKSGKVYIPYIFGQSILCLGKVYCHIYTLDMEI